jgi:hypothetical protein
MLPMLLILQMSSATIAPYPPPPLISPDTVFAEKDGLVAVEAEHFVRQSQNDYRAWYINSPLHRPMVAPDHDAASYDDASGRAYVEALPDLFHREDDPIVEGQNLGDGGKVAVLHYPIHFSTPGTYYIWTRLRSNDQEDNTVTAGINGTWPDTAKILQSPVDQKKWIWKSENRISRKPWKIGRATLEVPTAGIHDVQFAMREDGEEFDRFILARDPDYSPETMPLLPPRLKSGKLPKTFETAAGQPLSLHAPLLNPDGSLYGANVAFALGAEGLAMEAEDFYRQSKAQSRMWHLVTPTITPETGPDSDAPRVAGASGDAFLELLPDGRQKDEDALNNKSSIVQEGGKTAVLSYLVSVAQPGRYYLWVRARATDGDDNTLHVGLDGNWPESGKKLTFQSRDWGWSNTQRDTKAPIYLDIDKAGLHEIQLSMREDGAELDRLFLTDKAEAKPDMLAVLPSTVKKGDLAHWQANRATHMSRRPVAQPEKGVILIEAENIPATPGWRYHAVAKGDGAGHAGLGYLQWSEPGQGQKPGQGLLSYRFRIEEAGNYQILIRGKMADPTNRPETLDPDGNDIWLRIDGGADAKGAAPFKPEWNKLAILGHPTGWTWNSNLDQGAPHPITPAIRAFVPGVYTLTLSGRSEGYAIDRIVLLKVKGKGRRDFDQLGKQLDQSITPQALLERGAQ